MRATARVAVVVSVATSLALVTFYHASNKSLPLLECSPAAVGEPVATASPDRNADTEHSELVAEVARLRRGYAQLEAELKKTTAATTIPCSTAAVAPTAPAEIDGSKTACVDRRKPCVALVITGLVRSLIYPKVHRSIATHVVKALSDDGAQVDVHLYLDRSIEVNEGDSGEWKPGVQFKSEFVSDEDLAPTIAALRPALVNFYVSQTLSKEEPTVSGLNVWVMQNLISRQYSKHAANDRGWRHATAFAKDLGITYDWWLWHRADFAWGAPIPPLHHFSPNHISVPDLWGYNVNDRFAVAPQRLAYRVFDIGHIAKYRCIGGPSAGMHRAYTYKNASCSEKVFAEDFNASFAKTLMGFCCHQKNKTAPFGHDGVAEHVSQHAYADQPQETVGNGDVGFTDIQQHRLFTFLVRRSVGAKCGELGRQNGNAAVKQDPASIGLRLGCKLMMANCTGHTDCNWPTDIRDLDFTPYYLRDMYDQRCLTLRWNQSVIFFEQCDDYYHWAKKYSIEGRARLYEDPTFYRHSPEQMFSLYGSALILLDPRRLELYQCLDLEQGAGDKYQLVLRGPKHCPIDNSHGWRRMLDGRLQHRQTGRCLAYDQRTFELRGDNCMGEGKWRGWPDVRHKGGRFEAGKAYIRAIRIAVASSSFAGPRMS